MNFLPFGVRSFCFQESFSFYSNMMWEVFLSLILCCLKHQSFKAITSFLWSFTQSRLLKVSKGIGRRNMFFSSEIASSAVGGFSILQDLYPAPATIAFELFMFAHGLPASLKVPLRWAKMSLKRFPCSLVFCLQILRRLLISPCSRIAVSSKMTLTWFSLMICVQ